MTPRLLGSISDRGEAASPNAFTMRFFGADMWPRALSPTRSRKKKKQKALSRPAPGRLHRHRLRPSAADTATPIRPLCKGSAQPKEGRPSNIDLFSDLLNARAAPPNPRPAAAYG